MKLSEIKGERTLDVIADLVDPVANIAQDKAFMDIVKTKPAEGEDKVSAMVERVRGAIPLLLIEHRDDVVAIMATIEGVTVAEYVESLSLPKLAKDVMDVLTDEDLLGFLA